MTIGMVGMTAQNLWHKHLCDPDRAYLEAKIYPTLREAARFYLSFMKQCRKDAAGKILLGPSYSPEHGAMGIDNCPFDIAYVHYTFDAFAKASRELGKGQGIGRGVSGHESPACGLSGGAGRQRQAGGGGLGRLQVPRKWACTTSPCPPPRYFRRNR